jgi:hypothetical protein
MSRSVALVRTDVSEESIAFIIRVARIGELGTMLTATSNRSTLRGNSIHFSETSVLTRATRRNITEDGTHHSSESCVKWRRVVQVKNDTIIMASKINGKMVPDLIS